MHVPTSLEQAQMHTACEARALTIVPAGPNGCTTGGGFFGGGRFGGGGGGGFPGGGGGSGTGATAA